MNERTQGVVLTPSEEFFAMTREAFERNPDARVAFTTSGTSMLPMLRDRKDVVYLRRPNGKIKKYDVVLFQRRSGDYVLHRVVKIAPEGAFTICGDNQIVLERGIVQDQVLAVVDSFQRGKTTINCRRSILYYLYSRIWTKSRLWRRIWRAAMRRIKKIPRRHKKKSRVAPSRNRNTQQ